MAGNDDPFAFTGIGNDRTVIRPVPGGRVQDIPRNNDVFMPDQGQAVALERLGKLNPLETAASELLALAAQLYNRPTHPSPHSLRQQLAGEIQQFQAEAAKTGAEREVIENASYALCSTLDDAILNTPWGHQGSWGERTLLAEFHGEVFGGENFFHKLKEAGQNPAKNLYLLELMYLCLSFGFQGRYRLLDNGKAKLEQIQAWVMQLIRQQRERSEPTLSPHWKGVKVASANTRRSIPLWVFYAVAAGILLAVFLGLMSLLSVQAEPIKRNIDAIAFSGKPTLLAKPPSVDFAPTLQEAFAPEIKAGLVTIHTRDGKPVVELRGDKGKGLFASGRDRLLNEQREQVVRKVATTLAMEHFRPYSFTVMGYTDNIPIRNPIGFQDNRDLSRARARTVEELMKAEAPSLRLSVKGKGELEPIADNSTREGRARNRRVEIIMD